MRHCSYLRRPAVSWLDRPHLDHGSHSEYKRVAGTVTLFVYRKCDGINRESRSKVVSTEFLHSSLCGVSLHHARKFGLQENRQCAPENHNERQQRCDGDLQMTDIPRNRACRLHCKYYAPNSGQDANAQSDAAADANDNIPSPTVCTVTEWR